MKLEPKHIAVTVVLFAGILMSVIIGSFAYFTNGAFGFPLDDPWIHLQFAKNLHDYGSFSYFKDEAATSGSTAPLYTMILAVGFFVTQNEMILSYVLGVLFFVLGGWFMFRVSERLFSGNIIAACAATLLFMLEPRLQWIALSGMETTLFVALLLATFYYFLTQRPVALGISAGLLIWTRPEAAILIGVLIADVLYTRYILKEKTGESKTSLRWVARAGVLTLILAAGYILFNILLSGSILPNTYAAKVKYYSAGGEGFPSQVFAYLTGGVQVVFAVFLAGGIGAVLVDGMRRRTSLFVIPFLFSVGLFLAYWMKLPYLYQNGRYLMPMLPFLIMLGIHGIETLLQTAGTQIGVLKPRNVQRNVWKLLVGIVVVLSVYGSWQTRVLYQDFCKYISDRQVATAVWMRDHLPKEAVIGTHDIGAIAFYSGRKVVDMVGLVSPEMIQNIGNLDKLREFLVSKHVTHLALLRNWFEVVNVNPLFQTNEQNPEVMEVFTFDPSKAHFTSKEVNWLTDTGWRYLAGGNAQQGGPYAERAVQLDPTSSRAHHHFAWALMMIGDYDRADRELKEALALNPSYWAAYLAQAQIPLRQGNIKEGVARLERLVTMYPKMLVAEQQLGQIYEHEGDTARARLHFERYAKGMSGNRPGGSSRSIEE